MKNAVIICAHGHQASGLESGIKLIAGNMENLRIVDFEEGDNFEILDGRIKEAYESLNGAENVLFLTDLMGGTPFNRAVILYGHEKGVRVISGVNFGMAYQALVSVEDDIDAYAEEVQQAAKDSMAMFKFNDSQDNGDIEEDGI